MDEIRGLLTVLRARDRSLSVFGAETHRYELGRPLSDAEVKDFEQRTRIRLPLDYRAFITELGNGGAGPYNGLFPLGLSDSGYDLTPWKEGVAVGDLRAPFPYVERWNWPPARLTPQGYESQAEYESVIDQYWAPPDGAFPIYHRGCALRDLLVVSGPEAGHVWYDRSAEFEGIEPIVAQDGSRVTFADWYMAWITDALRELAPRAS